MLVLLVEDKVGGRDRAVDAFLPVLESLEVLNEVVLLSCGAQELLDALVWLVLES